MTDNAKPLTLTDLRREAAKWRDHPECVPGSHLDEVVGLLQGAVEMLAGDCCHNMAEVECEEHGCDTCLHGDETLTEHPECKTCSSPGGCVWEPKPEGDGGGVVE